MGAWLPGSPGISHQVLGASIQLHMGRGATRSIWGGGTDSLSPVHPPFPPEKETLVVVVLDVDFVVKVTFKV